MKKIALILLMTVVVFFPLTIRAQEDVYAKKGDSFLAEGKFPEAIDAFWLSIRNKPTQAYSYFRLSIAYESFGMRDMANKMKKRGGALAKHNEWLKRGREQANQNEITEAFVSFRHALDYYPESVDAYKAIGDLYTKMKQLDRAREAYTKAVELLESNKLKPESQELNSPSNEELEKISEFWDLEKRNIKRKISMENKYGFAQQLHAPIAHTNNNQLNSLVYTPIHEGAMVIKKGTYFVEVGAEIAGGKYNSNSNNWTLQYDQRLFEPFVKVSYGINDKLEVRGYLSLPTLKDAGNKGIVLDEGTTSYIPNEKRGWGLGDLVPSLKYNFFKSEDNFSGASGVLAVKMPFSQNKNFISSGGIDFSLNFIGNFKQGDFYNSVSAGFSFVGSPKVFDNNLTLNNVFALHASTAYMFSDVGSAHFQLDLLSNAFASVKNYDSFISTLSTGMKYQVEGALIEFSIGSGLTKTSSDIITKMSLIVAF